MADDQRDRRMRWTLLLAVPLGCFNPNGSNGDSSGTLLPSSSGEATSGQTLDPTTETLTTADGSSTGTAGSSTSSGGSVCGDGQVDGDEECDDSSVEPGDGCAADCRKEYRRVFVTSAVFTGNLGGLDGADAKCAAAAKSAGLSGTFRAWLSAEGKSPETRFVKSEVPYIRVDDVVVAANWQALVNGELEANISISENGGMPGLGSHSCEPDYTRVVWTNTQEKGTEFEPMPCSDWKGESGTALAGNAAFFNFSWTQTCSPICSDEAALYCFEQ